MKRRWSIAHLSREPLADHDDAHLLAAAPASGMVRDRWETATRWRDAAILAEATGGSPEQVEALRAGALLAWGPTARRSCGDEALVRRVVSRLRRALGRLGVSRE